MGVTDVKRLGGTPLGMVGACSGPSGAPPTAPVAPDRCPRTVPPNTGRGVVHLTREGPTARFLYDGGTYWIQSKRVFTGRGCERFREEFCCTCGRCGLYRFHRARKTSSESVEAA